MLFPLTWFLEEEGTFNCQMNFQKCTSVCTHTHTFITDAFCCQDKLSDC